jgi:tetratricopeptide (TPR) repeat protein
VASNHFNKLRELKQREMEGLYQELDTLVEQLSALRTARAIETDPLVKFKYQKQIETLEPEHRDLLFRFKECEKEYWRVPIDNLPCPRNPEWVGREQEQGAFHELLMQHRAELAKRGEASPVYVCCNGLPGVGKTQFALEYAHCHLGNFYKTAVWIDGSGPDLHNATAKAARDLNLVHGATPTDDQLIAALRGHLSQEGPHLVIFDNVDVPGAIGRYLPRRGDVCVIITARRKELPYASISYRVELLEPEKAMELLRGPKPLADPQEEQSAAELCADLGHLPLALMLARRVYRSGLRASLRELQSSIRHVGPARWRPSVDVDPFRLPYANLSALFEVSYQLLGPDARWVAAAGGYFAAAPIDRDLLCEAGAYLARAPIKSSADKERWIIALEEMDRMGLIEHTIDHTQRVGSTQTVVRVRIHLLLQDYLRSVTNDETAARNAVIEALASMVKNTPILAGPLRDLRHHLPHMLAILAHQKEHPQSLEGMLPAMYLVVLGVVLHACLMGEYGKGLALCERYLQPSATHPPAEPTGELIALRHQRAFALRSIREFDAALEDYQEVLRWRMQRLGPHHIYTYFPQHDIGAIYIEQHRYDEARKIFLALRQDVEAVLAQRGESQTYNQNDETRMRHIARALVLTDLGRAMIGATCGAAADRDALRFEAGSAPQEASPEDIAKAVDLFAEATEVFIKLRMPSDLFAARPMIAHAEALRMQAEKLPWEDETRRQLLRSADEKATHALNIRESQLSDEHPYLIEVYGVLGRIATAQRENEKAKLAYEQALRLSQRRVGRDRSPGS